MTDKEPAPEKPREDVLAYLPHSKTVEYRKGQLIYSGDRPSTGIYLVTSGIVKVSMFAEDDRELIVDLYQPDEVFGESALLNLPSRSEQAITLENTTTLMAWTTSEIEGIVMKRPRLGVALLQILVQRTIDLTRRIESLSVDSTARRLARSLIRFSDRLGKPESDGSVSMGPLTHELLSQYIGTSREIVTLHMKQFRKQGYLQYSRKGIILYRDFLREWLRQNV
jgi:CRP/FNR family transcriptional regulator